MSGGVLVSPAGARKLAHRSVGNRRSVGPARGLGPVGPTRAPGGRGAPGRSVGRFVFTNMLRVSDSAASLSPTGGGRAGLLGGAGLPSPFFFALFFYAGTAPKSRSSLQRGREG